VELLHGAQADALEPADDHVTPHAIRLQAIHQGMLPVRLGMEVAAALNVGARGLRGLEPALRL
jgi:hypothetical protein